MWTRGRQTVAAMARVCAAAKAGFPASDTRVHWPACWHTPAGAALRCTMGWYLAILHLTYLFVHPCWYMLGAQCTYGRQASSVCETSGRLEAGRAGCNVCQRPWGLVSCIPCCCSCAYILTWVGVSNHASSILRDYRFP